MVTPAASDLPHTMRLSMYIACAMLPVIAGCAWQRFAVDRAGDALAGGGSVYAADDDVELVGAAIPFGLKLTESLLAASPDHRGLLLAAARGFTQYAYVELPADDL